MYQFDSGDAIFWLTRRPGRVTAGGGFRGLAKGSPPTLAALTTSGNFE